MASFETRLQQLEEELRALTGRVEELEYRNRELERQLEALRAAATLPAAAVGGGPAAPVPSAAVPATPPVPSAAAPAPAPVAPPSAVAAAPAPATPAGSRTAPAPAVESDPAARRGWVLGTIPADVLRGAQGGVAGVPAGAGQTATRPSAPPLAADDPRLRAALEGPADSRYRAALDLLESGEFAAAEQAFSKFLEDFPNDPRAPTAAFWLGESHFFRQDYATAATVYARNYRQYGPGAPRAAETLLKLGMSLAALGERERACQTFAELEKRHPDAPAPVRQMLQRERTAAGCS